MRGGLSSQGDARTARVGAAVSALYARGRTLEDGPQFVAIVRFAPWLLVRDVVRKPNHGPGEMHSGKAIHRRLVAVAAGFGVAVGVSISSGCGRAPEEASEETSQDASHESAPSGAGGAAGLQAHPARTGEANPVPPDPGLTDALRAEFGAAAWVPADSAYFSSALRLAEQWDAVRESRAFASLIALSSVQSFFDEVRSSPPWRAVERARAGDPLLASAFEVLTDLVSNEVFVCLDSRWAPFAGAFAGVVVTGFLSAVPWSSAAFRSDAVAQDVIAAILARQNALRIPGTLVGFRVADPARAARVVDDLIARLRDAAPLPIEKRKIGQGEFWVLALDGRALPPPALDEVRGELRRSGLSPEQVDDFVRFAESFSVAIAVGLRNDYLLLSIGADTRQLESLDGAATLAASDAFAPLRRRMRPRVASISYVDDELSWSSAPDFDALLALLDGALEAGGEDLPTGFAARVQRDARELAADLRSAWPRPAADISASFLRDGYETWSFSAAAPGQLDDSRPLSLIAQAGARPLIAIAGRSPPMRHAYERFAHWVGVGHSYFEDFVVPTIPERDLDDVRRARELLVPALRELHRATLEDLLPAIDGAESLLVVDDGGELVAIPGLREKPSRPLRVPRPAWMVELHDAARLESAFSRYRGIVNTLLATVAAESRAASDFEVPPPAARPFAGGTLFGYALELGLLREFEPHAVVTPKRLVASIAPSQSAALLGPSTPRTSRVIDLGAPSGSITLVDIRGLVELLVDDVETLVEALARERRLPPDVARAVAEHAPALREVLGTLRSYESRSWLEGGLQATHSWLRIEDRQP